MKVLVIGSGGREHAIIWKLRESSKISKIYCAPGNGGISQLCECVEIESENIDELVKFSKKNKIDFVVVGPEVPLAMGITDRMVEANIKVFGPNKKCSQLEASKSFTKTFLKKHNIPTAKYKEYTCIDELKKDIGIFGYPMVLKADGLAAGKGVVLAKNYDEAYKTIEEMMGEKVFGSAGEKIVVEECLVGTEASVLCFVDENTIVPMESAQDYKRIFDKDEGPNTGGMGTYSPNRLFDEKLKKQIKERILDPTLSGFQKDGLDFRGVLFVGIMIEEDGPKVIEFNNRFGDPETQSVLPRLKTDLFEIMLAVSENRLSEMQISWEDNHTVCVVLASEGYPSTYAKGDYIEGIEYVADAGLNYEEVGEIVFHAGTKVENKTDGSAIISNEEVMKESENICDMSFVTSGGRVLGVTARGKTHEEACKNAYNAVSNIKFRGMQYRNDIGE